VLIDGDRIAGILTSDFDALGANQVFDFPNGIVLPGLVDLHAHPANTGSVFGVSPDTHMLPRGVTTVLSQGDAGADNIDEYVETTINASRTRVLLAINLSRVGESTTQGCLENLDDADIDACVAATERHREHIPAIAVNVSHHCCGSTDPREAQSRGLEVARQTGLPLLFGLRRPADWPLAEQLALLRPRDIVTYCFRREPHCVVENDHVLPCVLEARQRGVLFDIGHGTASFSLNVAEAAISDGFLPDTISTDLQIRHLDSQPLEHDLPLVMSKLRAAGMPDEDIFASVTSRPAGLLSRDVAVGSAADLTVLTCNEPRTLTDAHGRTKPGPVWSTIFTMRGGQPVAP
jgi:dihydroorotase